MPTEMDYRDLFRAIRNLPERDFDSVVNMVDSLVNRSSERNSPLNEGSLTDEDSKNGYDEPA